MKRYIYLLVLFLLSFSSHGAAIAETGFRLSIVTNDFVLPSKLTKLKNWAAAHQITLTGVYVEKIKEQPDWLNRDLVIVDTPRGGDRARVMAAIKSELDETRVPWVAVGGGPPLSGNLPAVVMRQLLAYYSAGGETNFNNMFAYIIAWQQQKPLDNIAKPLAMPEAGIYHFDADGIFESWQDYLLWGQSRWATDAPVLAIAMSSSFISNSQTQFYDELMKKIEQAGGIPLVFWFDRLKPSGIQDVIAAAKPVMLVNTTHMIAGDIRQAEFRQLDIPVVIGLTSRDYDIASWRQAEKGIPAHTTAAMVTIPESWGLSDPLVLAALEEGEPKAIPEQLDLLVGRFMAMAKLKQQPVAQTRLALMFWNSPSGEKNLSAS
ncbi:MAG TPA: cobaltochelatase subunit CobN, partial [Methylophaga sp.]|nr:cobaltochelatase subunit CobN [Methylophaga sp.]